MGFTDPIEACRFWLHDTGSPPIFTDPAIQEFLDLEKVDDASGTTFCARLAGAGCIAVGNVRIR
jgi:hypothetical protein